MLKNSTKTCFCDECLIIANVPDIPSSKQTKWSLESSTVAEISKLMKIYKVLFKM